MALAKAVKYQSAGTVEFVVGKDQDFYFLEMNTRLQVEHPVTECITGLDLVELMLRVAAGEKLPFTQAQVPRSGWAMECRINAEDPYRNFLPSTGRLVRYAPPPTTMEAAQRVSANGGVRVDTGVYEGGEIPMQYDSMVAKLIVHGTDRLDAIERMRFALNEFVVRGISTNIPFQAALLQHPDFIAGNFDTGFIAKHYPKGFTPEHVKHEDPAFPIALAAYVRRKARGRAVGITGQLPGHEAKLQSDFVVVVMKPDGHHTHHEARVESWGGDGHARVVVEGRSYDIHSEQRLGEILVRGTVNGEPFAAKIERGTGTRQLAIRIAHNGAVIEAMVLSPRIAHLARHMPHKPPADTSKLLLSPMPGLLADVFVKPGQWVTQGERLAVIEAMKMENILTASRDGTVKELLAGKGESLAVDQPILSFAD